MSAVMHGSRRFWLARLCAPVLLAALAGCGTMLEGRVDPALFPRGSAATAPFPGRVDVLSNAASLQSTVTGERLYDLAAARVQMPIGRIVHEAALAAFGQTFRGGAQVVDRLDSVPASRPAAIVVLRATQFGYRDRLQYLIPLGPLVLERSQLDLQLSLQLRLLDPDGVILWTQTYDSGLRIWEPPRGKIGEPLESRFEGLVRLTHETVWQLTSEAVRDVGEWLRNEWLRERQL
jgi:hypothetical protein